MSLLLVVVILASALGYFVFQTSNSISSLKAKDQALQSSLADLESKASAQNTALQMAITNVSARLEAANVNTSERLNLLSSQLSTLLGLKATVQNLQVQLSLLSSDFNSTRNADAAFQATVSSQIQSIEVELGNIESQISSLLPPKLLYSQIVSVGTDGGPRWCGEKLSNDTSSSSYLEGSYITKVAFYMSSRPTNASVLEFSSIAPNGTLTGLVEVADSVTITGPYNFQNSGDYWYNFTFSSPVYLSPQNHYIIAVSQATSSAQMFTNQGFPGTGDRDPSSFVVCGSPSVAFPSQDATMALFGFR